LCRRFAEVDVAAGECPFAKLRLDTSPQQQDTAALDHDASGYQLRPWEIDIATAAADFEALAVGQHDPRPHLATAQRTEADILRVLMLNVMVRLDRTIVVAFITHFKLGGKPDVVPKRNLTGLAEK
jgi:hypothetical protein